MMCGREVQSQEYGFDYKYRIYKDSRTFKTRLLSEEHATFSSDLFVELYKTFFSEIRYFQVVQISNPMSVLDKIDDYNFNVEKRKEQYKKYNGSKSLNKLTRTQKFKLDLIEFNHSRLKTYLEALDEGLSLNEIRESFNIKKSAYYDLRRILKKFSFNEQRIKTKYDFSDIRIDFLHYYRNLSNRQYANNFFSPNEVLAIRSDSYMYKVSI